MESRGESRRDEMFMETNNSLDRPAPIYGREKHPAPNGAAKSFGAVVSINISPLRGFAKSLREAFPREDI